jgi:hypothetical protein
MHPVSKPAQPIACIRTFVSASNGSVLHDRGTFGWEEEEYFPNQ